MGKFKERFTGDRNFYRMVLAIAVPILIQNGITNFVNMLDNIMVGRIGTEQMSGVSIVNQLVFVYNLCLFGGFSGAGIFTAQYNGTGDQEGIRGTFRFKLLLGVVLFGIAFIVLKNWGAQLIGLFLNGSSDGGDLESTLKYGLDYLDITIWGLIPFMFIQAYSSTLRECGETVLPMRASIVSVLVNLVFNYFLIYGKLGFPCLGVRGAAIATVLSRVVELTIILIFAAKSQDKYPFFRNLYSSFRIPGQVAKKILIKGSPLLVNELLWSSGQTILNQCYSLRGLTAVAAFNINSTISNLLNSVVFAIGASLGIIVGKLLGAGKTEEAEDTDRKIIFFSVCLATCVALFLMPAARKFPLLYNTNESVRNLAKSVITIQVCVIPIAALKNCTYYTLRSGGRTVITFLFDCGMVWLVNIPIAFCLSHFTDLDAAVIFAFVQLSEILKSVLGIILVKKKIWIKNIIA